MYQFEFKKRAPSKSQIMSHIKCAVSDGHATISLVWGENEISIEKGTYDGVYGPWFGYGWIGRVGGDDIAQELSSRALVRFLPTTRRA